MTTEEFQKLIAQCQPHQVFKLDWNCYTALEFADIFLPDVGGYEGKAMRFYDGAELFKNFEPTDRKLYQLTNSPNLITIVTYSYPKGVEAERKKHLVEPQDHELCAFIEIDEDENIEVFFRTGSNFKEFLYDYAQKNKSSVSPSTVENTVYKTDAEKFKAHFNRTIVHYNMMEFVLKTIGIDEEKTFQHGYEAKLQRLLAANKIEEMVYANVFLQNGKKQYVTIAITQGTQGLNYNINITDKEPDGQQPEKYVAIKKANVAQPLMFVTDAAKPLAVSPVTQSENGSPQLNDEALKQVYTELNKAGFSENPAQKQESEFDLAEIAQTLTNQLSNPFYQDVKMLVRVGLGKTEAPKPVVAPKMVDGITIPSLQTNSAPNPQITDAVIVGDLNNYDVAIDIAIDEKGNITIKHHAHENYLKEYVDKWKQEAGKRGLEVNIEDLRQQVLQDFTDIETEKGFYNKFIQGVKATFSDKIAGYVEGVQATQKVAKNVWAEGAINESIWYSQDEEHEQWPKYIHTAPIVGGAVDGVIDEIVGIPMAIKSVYEIATDGQKLEAFKSVFTKEGFGKLIEGLKEQLFGDKERREHTAGQTTVSVAAMMIPGGQISKTGKLANQLSDTQKGLNELTNPTVLTALENLKKAERYNPDIAKAIKEFLREIDPKTLDKLADAPGFDKVLKDMGQHWNKFRGGKFVLEYASKTIADGKIIKFEVSVFSDTARRVYDITFDVIDETGETVTKFLELKNWSIVWESSLKNQFVKDLENMTALGSHIWIFNKQGVIQDINKLRENVLKALKKADDTPIDELGELLTKSGVKEKLKVVFGEGVDTPTKLLDELNKPEIFNQIFEIVE